MSLTSNGFDHVKKQNLKHYIFGFGEFRNDQANPMPLLHQVSLCRVKDGWCEQKLQQKTKSQVS